MKAFTYIVLAVTMVLGVQAVEPEAVEVEARGCLPRGSNQCDLSGWNNCCSGFCNKPADWAKGICM